MSDDWGSPPEAFGLDAPRCGCRIDWAPDGSRTGALVHKLCDEHEDQYNPRWSWSVQSYLDHEVHQAVLAHVERSGMKYDKAHRPAGPTPNFAVARPKRTG